MKVKIGDKIYDGEEQPIMIVFTEADKNNIKAMPNDYFKYCSYPNSYTIFEIKDFMEKTSES